MSISEDHISSKNPRTMNVEPHWPSMFALAIEVVSKQIDKDCGRDFVIEMLEFGKRLEATQ